MIGSQSAGELVRVKLQALMADKDYAYRSAVSDVEYQKAIATLGVEVQRLKIVAKKEQTEAEADFDEKDAKWDLEVFQYGANVLASAAGGTVQHPSSSKNNKTVSAIGGAVTGAAVGGMAAYGLMQAGAINGWNPAGWAMMAGGAIIGGISAMMS